LNNDTPALIHELQAEAPVTDRCPHLEHGEHGCDCRRVAERFAAELPAEEADQAAAQLAQRVQLRDPTRAARHELATGR
jgi:hypothetical protein